MGHTVSLDLDAISRAAARHGVAALELFGSAVAGDFATDSDVDFLVDFLPDRTDTFEDFCGLRDELRRIAERDVDLVVKRAIRNPYFRESALARRETVYVAHAYRRREWLGTGGLSQAPLAQRDGVGRRQN